MSSAAVRAVQETMSAYEAPSFKPVSGDVEKVCSESTLELTLC